MTQNPDGSAWSERLARGVASEMRRHRQAKGMSAQQLSDRCTELGMPIQRSVLANMESGRRATVTVAELLILAAALDVAPAQLLFPVGFAQRAEPLPGKSVEPLRAVEWVDGRRGIEGYGKNVWDNPISAHSWHSRLVDMVRGDRRRRDELRHEYVRVSRDREENRERLHVVRAQLQEADERLLGRARELHFEDGQPPDYTKLVVERDYLAGVEAQISRALSSYEYLRENIDIAEKQLQTDGRRLAKTRQRMQELGWLLPELAEDIAEYVPELGEDDDGDLFGEWRY